MCKEVSSPDLINRKSELLPEARWFTVSYWYSNFKNRDKVQPGDEKARYVFVNASEYGIVWTNVLFFALGHIAAFYTIYRHYCIGRAIYKTWIFLFIISSFSGLGITVGAHRLWAHKAYKASFGWRLIMSFLFTAAGMNDLFVWIRDHRLHHKFTETDADPHNSRRGVFFR